MTGASARMGSLAWSFFSGGNGGRACNESVPFSASGGLNLDEESNFVANNNNYSVGFGISDFPDANCYYEGQMFDSGFGAAAENNRGGQGQHGIRTINPNGLVCSSPRYLEDIIGALQKYLPSNNEDEEAFPAVDAYSCDEFRMYEFKVRRCMRGRSHDWTECPFAHPGEKARRRDPRRFHYSGTACPDFRKGSCRRGDACDFAHGVFECWLHPARYRTQPCKDGRNCKRRVCFFAHTPEQLRLLPSASVSSQAANCGGGSRSSLALHASAVKNSLTASYDGSPRRHMLEVDGSNPAADGGSVSGSPRGGYLTKGAQAFISSPTSTLVGHPHSPPPLSPPLSPSVSPPDSPEAAWLNSVNVNCRISRGFHKSALAQAQNQTLPFVQTSNAHRRHLDRMASMPSITLPTSPSTLRPPNVLSGPSSPVAQASPKSVVELMNSLQSLELNSWYGSPRGSNLRPCVSTSSSLCNTPKPNFGENMAEFKCDNSAEIKPIYGSDSLAEIKPIYGSDSLAEIKTSPAADSLTELLEEPVQRVESGRDLRAKIYGRLNKQNLQELPSSESSPDLGWVNELIK